MQISLTELCISTETVKDFNSEVEGWMSDEDDSSSIRIANRLTRITTFNNFLSSCVSSAEKYTNELVGV
jgi:hypothetical protein